jgi:hypothetical protein
MHKIILRKQFETIDYNMESKIFPIIYFIIGKISLTNYMIE